MEMLVYSKVNNVVYIFPFDQAKFLAMNELARGMIDMYEITLVFSKDQATRDNMMVVLEKTTGARIKRGSNKLNVQIWNDELARTHAKATDTDGDGIGALETYLTWQDEYFCDPEREQMRDRGSGSLSPPALRRSDNAIDEGAGAGGTRGRSDALSGHGSDHAEELGGDDF